MQGFGARLIVVGFLLLAGAGVYWMANQKTESELQIEQLQIEVDNTGRELGNTEGPLETRSAVAIHKQVLERAYWPAGLGALFLMVGWAALGSAKASTSSDSSSKDAGAG